MDAKPARDVFALLERVHGGARASSREAREVLTLLVNWFAGGGQQDLHDVLGLPKTEQGFAYALGEIFLERAWCLFDSKRFYTEWGRAAAFTACVNDLAKAMWQPGWQLPQKASEFDRTLCAALRARKGGAPMSEQAYYKRWPMPEIPGAKRGHLTDLGAQLSRRPSTRRAGFASNSGDERKTDGKRAKPRNPGR